MGNNPVVLQSNPLVDSSGILKESEHSELCFKRTRANCPIMGQKGALIPKKQTRAHKQKKGALIPNKRTRAHKQKKGALIPTNERGRTCTIRGRVR